MTLHTLPLIAALLGVLALCAALLHRNSRRLGIPFTVFLASLADAALLTRPGAPALRIARLLWLFVTAATVFNILHPIWNAQLRHEYSSMQGGIVGAIIAYIILYIPFAAVYVYIVNRQLTAGRHGKMPKLTRPA